MPKKKKIAVVTIDLPWRNVDYLGTYSTFKEANKAVKELCESFFGILSTPYEFHPIRCYGNTYAQEKDGEDGYELYYIDPGDDCECCVLEEDLYTGETEIRGPYPTVKDANEELFGKKSRRRFRLTAGTLGPGYYPITTRRKSYVYLPLRG